MRIKMGKALALCMPFVCLNKGFDQARENSIAAAEGKAYDLGLGHLSLL
jgi:hypothetical protein